MSDKLNLTIVCGGQSAEHEISVLSSKNILNAVDKTKYNCLIIYISKQGHWYLIENTEQFIAHGPHYLLENNNAIEIAITMGANRRQWLGIANSIDFKSSKSAVKEYPVDCVFPVLHGPFGEDGTIQGLFEMMNVPYVGADVLSSSICMNKSIAKQLLRQQNLPTPNWITLYQSEKSNSLNYQDLAKQLSEVMFVKPANLGSSIGISKVQDQQTLEQAIAVAFDYDDTVIIEACIKGRELECSVLGNEHPVASLPGEIIPTHEFYSYEAKYLDENGAGVVTPADLPENIIEKIQLLAVKAYQTLRCTGMARVDFFLKDDQLFINELNTIPGFTNISMYPKNWEASGLSYSRLLDDLIQLAIQRYHQKQALSKEQNTLKNKSSIETNEHA